MIKNIWYLIKCSIESAASLIRVAAGQPSNNMLDVSRCYIAEIRRIEGLIRQAYVRGQKEISYEVKNQNSLSCLSSYFASCGFVVNPNDTSNTLRILWVNNET